MKLKYAGSLEAFIELNEDELLYRWDTYKYEHGAICGEYFHYDNVDYFNEDLFTEMCGTLYDYVNSKEEL